MHSSWKASFLLAAILSASPALANPRNCLDIQMQNYMAADGDYVIEPVIGQPFTVTCVGMSSWAPREYLPLVNTGGNYNFGQYTAGGASPGTDVRTSFTKLRIDPKTLTIDIGDLTFATSTGQVLHANGGYVTQVPYAVALDCTASSTGAANIDLTGTSFAVKSVFYANGWYASGSISSDGKPAQALPASYPQNGVAEFTSKGKVVNVSGGGYCGSAGPRGFNSSHGFWLGARPGMLALQLSYVGM
jgi:hypothetical protein